MKSEAQNSPIDPESWGAEASGDRYSLSAEFDTQMTPRDRLNAGLEAVRAAENAVQNDPDLRDVEQARLELGELRSRHDSLNLEYWNMRHERIAEAVNGSEDSPEAVVAYLNRTLKQLDQREVERCRARIPEEANIAILNAEHIARLPAAIPLAQLRTPVHLEVESMGATRSWQLRGPDLLHALPELLAEGDRVAALQNLPRSFTTLWHPVPKRYFLVRLELQNVSELSEQPASLVVEQVEQDFAFTVTFPDGKQHSFSLSGKELENAFPGKVDSQTTLGEFLKELSAAAGVAHPFGGGRGFHLINGQNQKLLKIAREEVLREFALEALEMEPVACERGMLANKIRRREDALAERLKETSIRREVLLPDFSAAREYLEVATQKNARLDGISWVNVASPFRRKDVGDMRKFKLHTVAVNGSPVVRMERKERPVDQPRFSFIATERKDRPFELRQSEVPPKDFEVAERWSSHGEMDFFTVEGIPVPEEYVSILQDLFLHAEQGIRFFPKDQPEKVSSEFRKRERERLQPRSWSQRYLHERAPDEIVRGELKVGGAMKFYVWHAAASDMSGQTVDLVVAEHNETGHATYWGTRRLIQDMAVTNLLTLREKRPESMAGYMIHPAGSDHDPEKRREWEVAMDKILPERMR